MSTHRAPWLGLAVTVALLLSACGSAPGGVASSAPATAEEHPATPGERGSAGIVRHEMRGADAAHEREQAPRHPRCLPVRGTALQPSASDEELVVLGEHSAGLRDGGGHLVGGEPERVASGRIARRDRSRALCS